MVRLILRLNSQYSIQTKRQATLKYLTNVLLPDFAPVPASPIKCSEPIFEQKSEAPTATQYILLSAKKYSFAEVSEFFGSKNLETEEYNPANKITTKNKIITT
jgi:hypothetical protein